MDLKNVVIRVTIIIAGLTLGMAIVVTVWTLLM